MGALLSGMMYIPEILLAGSVLGWVAYAGLVGRRSGKRRYYRRLKGTKAQWLEKPLALVFVATAAFKLYVFVCAANAILDDPVAVRRAYAVLILALVAVVPLYMHASYLLVADVCRRVVKRWPWLVARTADLTPLDADKFKAAFVKTLADNTGMNY